MILREVKQGGRGFSHDSSVSIALAYVLDDRGSRVRFLLRLGIFLFTIAVSRTTLEPAKSPIQWIKGTFPWG
jgi:hypothetical protein